jgi:hypothetical protein
VIATISGSFIGGSASTFTNSVNVDFSTPVYSVGAYFGNDFVPFSTVLSLYDASNDLVGTYSLQANGNISVDQFLGLQSSAPFVRARFENSSVGFAVVLDDLTFSSTAPQPVPLPGALWLLGSGLGALVAVRQRKSRGGPGPQVAAT